MFFSKYVSVKEVESMRSRYYNFQVIAMVLGIYMGVQVTDYLFFDEEKYLILREQTQELYWQQWGKPTELKPKMVPCLQFEKKGQLCESFIEITSKRDNKYLHRVDSDLLEPLN